MFLVPLLPLMNVIIEKFVLSIKKLKRFDERLPIYILQPINILKWKIYDPNLKATKVDRIKIIYYYLPLHKFILHNCVNSIPFSLINIIIMIVFVKICVVVVNIQYFMLLFDFLREIQYFNEVNNTLEKNRVHQYFHSI